MRAITVISILLPTFIYATYNPFFTETKTVQITEEKTVTIIEKPKPKPIPEREDIKMTYFGFIESSKGKFALVNFNDKNIVIQQNDSLYINEKVYKIATVTSNFIHLSDRFRRKQTVYFSSDKERGLR